MTYITGVAIVRRSVPNVKAALGFSAPALALVGDGPGGAEPIDVTSEGGFEEVPVGLVAEPLVS